MADPALYTVAADLLACVETRLSHTAAGSPTRSCVTTGEIAWDGCDCGQLEVSILRAFLGSTPTSSQAFAGACRAPYVFVEYVVSLLRCAPSPRDTEVTVDCKELTAAAVVAADDANAVRAGVACCLEGLVGAATISDFVMQEQTFVGPAGGCVGSEQPVLVSFINACPC